ncbi:alpha/beta fold hydrolase [Clostridium sp. P21]|uniref:Alpha/beta fold hydrolase n=1 Tax=Clostridium muellerianum TaxID=2716538 RepID=A0A7Y0EHV7_9CLOT|nr:alpha/beta fold hydrolase [Clostridium muellerianum]NMM63770.1 alpha/beta fold hydrolase [Clostridium muellerianum]
MLNRNVRLSLILAITACTFISSSVYADGNVSIKRLSGNDRYETSANIANYYQAGQLDSIIVTSGNGFADALSSSSLQGIGGSPVMLVGDNIQNSSKTINYIENHLKKDGTIYILGGEASVNSEFEKYFKEKGFNKIIRLGGNDRYETNIKIVNQTNVREGTPIVIANGDNFPDALSISSIAAYKGYPVFITPFNSLPSKTEEKIKKIKPSKIYVIGGSSSISSGIEDKLKQISKDIVRIQGKDRYETSMNICKYFDENLDNVIIASGEAFPDALSGTALSAKLKAPIVITDGNNISSIKEYIKNRNFRKVIILGGEGTVSKNMENVLSSNGDTNLSQDLKVKAESFVSNLSNKNIDEALKQLSSDLKTGYGEGIMKNYLSSVSFKGVDTKPIDVKQEEAPLGNVITLTYKVEAYSTTVDVKIKYDNGGQIYDLVFENTSAVSKYKLPAYANMDSFIEKNVIIGDGKYKLPGVLSMPKGNGPFPAVVLVHGSGASDKDETNGDTKVFRDISAALASKGIAVLRYDKRTEEYVLPGLADTKFDLNKETVNDAVDAVSLLKKTEGIDSNKVFVLGHSQGAMLTSTIIKDCGDNGAAGGIMMAGPVDFLDTFLEQVKYLNSIGQKNESMLKSVENLYNTVKSKDFPGNMTEDMPLFGAYPYYWLSVKNSTQVNDAVSIKAPLLILQGKMDYQVDVSNVDKWKNILKNKQNVDYKSYDKLNHFFIETKSKSMEGYGKAANVPDYVLNDITNWINRYSK